MSNHLSEVKTKEGNELLMKKEYIAPFKVGGHVEPAYFAGREKELQKLTRDAMGLVQSNVIIGPRRYGKTWLLQRVKQIVEQGSDVIMPYINCRDMNSYFDFNRTTVTSILEAYEKKADLKQSLALAFNRVVKGKAKEAIKRIEKVSVSLSEVGEFCLIFRSDEHDKVDLLRSTFQFINKFAEEKDLKMILIFDEFQNTEEFDGILFNLFKVYMDDTTRVKYFFSGSSLSLLQDVFVKYESPLYMMATKLFMEPLKEEVVKEYISGQFRLRHVTIEDDALTLFYTFTGGIPFYLQKLGELCFKMVKDCIIVGDVEEAYSLMLNELDSDFEERFTTRFTDQQQQILKAIAISQPLNNSELAKVLYCMRESIPFDIFDKKRNKEKEEICSQEESHFLSPLKRLCSAMIVLEDRQKKQYRLSDDVFCQWLVKRIGG